MKFNQITLYSKLLALVLLVALPFLGFYAGVKYQQAIVPTDKVIDNNGLKDNNYFNTTDWKAIVESDQITVKTKYENKTLKYSGTVQLQTPCHQLKDQSGVMESYPEQVRIQLVVEPPPSGTVCAQVMTEREFTGGVQVSEKAVVSVFLNGEKIR